MLRGHALAAGLDPAFTVLDAQDAERLADDAFDEALEELARGAPGAIDLIAVIRRRRPARRDHPGARRAALARRAPAAAAAGGRGAGARAGARTSYSEPPAAALAELAAIAEPGAKVLQAIARLERLPEVLGEAEDPWPGDLWGLALPGGNGAALCTEACARYSDALAEFRGAVEHRRAARAHDLLDRLLRLFGERYARAKREVSGLDFEDLELECRELLRSDARAARALQGAV